MEDAIKLYIKKRSTQKIFRKKINLKKKCQLKLFRQNKKIKKKCKKMMNDVGGWGYRNMTKDDIGGGGGGGGGGGQKLGF